MMEKAQFGPKAILTNMAYAENMVAVRTVEWLWRKVLLKARIIQQSYSVCYLKYTGQFHMICESLPRANLFLQKKTIFYRAKNVQVVLVVLCSQYLKCRFFDFFA